MIKLDTIIGLCRKDASSTVAKKFTIPTERISQIKIFFRFFIIM